MREREYFHLMTLLFVSAMNSEEGPAGARPPGSDRRAAPPFPSAKPAAPLPARLLMLSVSGSSTCTGPRVPFSAPSIEQHALKAASLLMPPKLGKKLDPNHGMLHGAEEVSLHSCLDAITNNDNDFFENKSRRKNC